MRDALRSVDNCGENGTSYMLGHCCRRAGAGSPRIDLIRNVTSRADCTLLCEQHPGGHYLSHSKTHNQCVLCEYCDFYPAGTFKSLRVPNKRPLNADMKTFLVAPASSTSHSKRRTFKQTALRMRIGDR